MLFLLIFGDDIRFTGSSSVEIDNITNRFILIFALKDLGSLLFSLG